MKELSNVLQPYFIFKIYGYPKKIQLHVKENIKLIINLGFYYKTFLLDEI